MNAWISFWSAFLFVTLAAFAVMSIVVAIGGALDIRKLFRRLNERDRNEIIAEREAPKSKQP